jgi:cysteine desulfurase family protein (TIGR01976 family)
VSKGGQVTTLDVEYVRGQFPALARVVNGRPAAYLDSPGGTQVPERVVAAVAEYLTAHNCNLHGAFATGRETDLIVRDAHAAMADFLGCEADEVSFGANMTTLNLLLAQALVRAMEPGDEVIITQLDHEANRAPWLALADHGIVVREVPVDVDTCTLRWDRLEAFVGARTRVIAVGYASNVVGTVNHVARIASIARAAGAYSVVDAVHFALHGAIDVRDLDCDFLLCSAYKFFGPHVGVVYGRRAASTPLRPLQVCTKPDRLPDKYETGTMNHEGLAGTTEAIEFIADLGRQTAGTCGTASERRQAVVAGMLAIEEYERPLALRLRQGLFAIPGVRVYGPPEGHPCTSTVAFTVAGRHPNDVASALGDEGLFVWDGDFYATTLVRQLGLGDGGGMVRIGLAPYNTMDEVERVISAVRQLA